MCTLTKGNWRYRKRKNQNIVDLEEEDWHVYAMKMEEILREESERNNVEKMSSLLEKACNKTVKMISEKKDVQKKKGNECQGLPQEIIKLIKKRDRMRNRNRISMHDKIVEPN